MDYVLVHGDIHPYRPVLATSTQGPDSTADVESRPGIPLMPTCKQAYQEGHKLYYSCSTFHLPPIETFRWSDGLEPEHKAMIKRVSITIGLVNLSLALLKQIESKMPDDGSVKYRGWGAAVGAVLFDVWTSNVEYIAAWNSLDEIELRRSDLGSTHVLQHRDIVARVGHGPDLHWHQNAYWSAALQPSYVCVVGNVEAKVDRVGWVKTKEWLMARKPDEMAEGFSSGIKLV